MSDPHGTSSGTSLPKPYFTEATTGEVTKLQNPIILGNAIAPGLATSPIAISSANLLSGAPLITSAQGTSPSVPSTTSATATVIGVGQALESSTALPISHATSGVSTTYTASGHKVTVKTYAIKRG